MPTAIQNALPPSGEPSSKTSPSQDTAVEEKLKDVISELYYDVSDLMEVIRTDLHDSDTEILTRISVLTHIRDNVLSEKSDD
jgi:hypothetical protein